MEEFIVFREPFLEDGRKGFRLHMGLRKDADSYFPRTDFNEFSSHAEAIPPNAEFEVWEEKRISHFYDLKKSRMKPLQCKPIGYENADLYFTHDNGSRPFAVYVTDKNVAIYTYQDDKTFVSAKDYETYLDNWQMYTVKVCEYENVVSILIGEDPYSMNWPDQTDPDYAKGACVLIHVTPGQYVFVCTSVKSFEFTLEPIESLRGTLGNNDVIYPVAETKKRYLFLNDEDDVWMFKNKLTVPTTQDWDGDYYYHFYGHSGHKPKPEDLHKLQKVKILHSRLY